MANQTMNDGVLTFQSAPPTEARGDFGELDTAPTADEQFQSAPPTEARGDSTPAASVNPSVSFQSAPPTEARGDANRSRPPDRPQLFQSAPPTEARGDWVGYYCWREGLICFNPLPPPRRGEIASPVLGIRRQGCFNPLPPPRRGEIVTVISWLKRSSGFNPLPPPRRGEITWPQRKQLAGWDVSIRSPHRGEGRFPYSLSMSRRKSSFQSAPPTEARGDNTMSQHPRKGPTGFNPLPPPRRGEIHGMEIRLPYEGCFNPLPPPRRGEIYPNARLNVPVSGFQSAPPTEARGDHP